MPELTSTHRDEIVAAARDLARAGRWQRATALLDATTAPDAAGRALLAVAAAEVAVESDWFAGTADAAARIAAAEHAAAAAELTAEARWDLAFLRLRMGYHDLLMAGGDRDRLPDLVGRAEGLRSEAPGDVRRGWAEFYLGVIADNLVGDRDAAPAHYAVALRAGESGDPLLAREALRHLGDHDHDRGDHRSALDRWRRATAVGAAAGAVLGTLSQQMLLAVLARDAGDEAGAAALAGEIARWAGALGADRLAAQATAFLSGADPTRPPADDE